MTALRLIGTYQVPILECERQWITDHVTMSAVETERELADVVLLEFEVLDESHEFDAGVLQQQGSEQVPWLERYFTVDGLRFLGEERPNLAQFRVCFFLHRFDPGVPITSIYGTIIPGRPLAMPDHLRAICVYEHPG